MRKQEQEDKEEQEKKGVHSTIRLRVKLKGFRKYPISSTTSKKTFHGFHLCACILIRGSLVITDHNFGAGRRIYFPQVSC